VLVLGPAERVQEFGMFRRMIGCSVKMGVNSGEMGKEE